MKLAQKIKTWVKAQICNSKMDEELKTSLISLGHYFLELLRMIADYLKLHPMAKTIVIVFIIVKFVFFPVLRSNPDLLLEAGVTIGVVCLIYKFFK